MYTIILRHEPPVLNDIIREKLEGKNKSVRKK